MNSAGNQDRDVRGKSASLMQSITLAPSKQLGEAELDYLKTAANGLARMTNATWMRIGRHYGAPSERLDQLLSDMRTGKRN